MRAWSSASGSQFAKGFADQNYLLLNRAQHTIDITVIARLAINAMHDPTNSMGEAGYAAWDAFGEEAVMGPEELIAIWRAMVRAALRGEP